MTDEEKQTMQQYGITHETKTIFHFEGHKYERLSDAINYAKKGHSEGKSNAGKSAA
jgi:hypothetical protein